MKIILASVALIIGSASAVAQTARPAPTPADARQDQVENDPVQQDAQRQREAAESTAVVTATNPSHGWDSAPGQKLMSAIKYRRYKWADFDQAVFNPNALPTDDMMLLIAESPYAADIAYYLAKHPAEASPITHMTLAQSGAAIRAIEGKVKPVVPAN